MKFDRLPILALTSALTSACSTSGQLSSTELCQQFSKYVSSVPRGQASFVQLERHGVWLIDHSKSCAHTEGDEAAAAFCSWLMDQISTEFMESPVTLAVACVQGQRIQGYIGNTGIESWEGRLRSFSPRFGGGETAPVEISWRIPSSGDAWDDHLRFEVVPE